METIRCDILRKAIEDALACLIGVLARRGDDGDLGGGEQAARELKANASRGGCDQCPWLHDHYLSGVWM